MFKETDLDEFINKMFESGSKSSDNDIKTGLKNFRKYLDDTNMCSGEYLQKLDKIIECSDELVSLKSKINSLDVTSLIETSQPTAKKELPKQKKINRMPSYQPSSNNHRSHYVYDQSSSCYGSSPTYSSSCGGGGSTYRGC